MIERYQVLTNRITFEISNLETVILRGKRAMKAYHSDQEDKDLFLDSVALSLHDFYTGLEVIFTKIATIVDGNLPTGNQWHQDLLIQMSLDLSITRPPVISNQTLEQLDEYRRFRHVLRNVYGFQLDSQKIEPLIERSPTILAQVKGELLAFADLLDHLS